MITFKSIKIYQGIFLTLMFIQLSYATNIYLQDNYHFDHSSENDHVAFEEDRFRYSAEDVDYSDDPDLVCFNPDKFDNTDDYTGDESIFMDDCIYEFPGARDQCISCYDITLPSEQMASGTFTTLFLNKICKDCTYDTSERFGDWFQVQTYYNCDSCSNSFHDIVEDPYYVINPRQFLCKNNEDDDFAVIGRFANREEDGDLEWVEYDSLSCSFFYNSRYGCSEALDQVNDNTGSTLIPFPCAIKDGFSCSSNNDCISNICGGIRNDLISACDSDGSNSYNLYIQVYENSCGGEGELDEEVSYSYDCGSDINSDYVCDSDLDGIHVNNFNDFCKLKEYASCNSNSECWNDNGGYDCMGSSSNKICTTGGSGKTCFNNDDSQCDSGRCDSTCLARATNGASCDENSDCMNGTCSGGICGGSGVTADLSIVDIIPVQVIKNVDLVKGKSGIIRVVVNNSGPNPASGIITATFDGVNLDIIGSNTEDFAVGEEKSFDFYFNPSSSGTKQIIANVTVV